jgi:predicted Zn-dependent protease
MHRTPAALPLLASLLCLLSCATPAASGAGAGTAGGGETGGVSVASSAEVRAEEAVRQGAWGEAEARTAALVEAQPASARAWLLRGQALLGAGKAAEAVGALERSVALGDSARARYGLGTARAQGGQLEGALADFLRAVELEPGYGLGWKSVAKAQAALGRFPEAARALLEAQRLRPTDAEAEELGGLLGQALAARQLPREALQHHARAGALEKQGRAADAEAAYRAALAQAPAFADCHYRLGMLARARGAQGAAEEALRAALAGYRADEDLLRAEAQLALADVLLAQGGTRAAEAVALAKAAISARGERPVALDVLARACQAAGDEACARDARGQLEALQGQGR